MSNLLVYSLASFRNKSSFRNDPFFELCRLDWTPPFPPKCPIKPRERKNQTLKVILKVFDLRGHVLFSHKWTPWPLKPPICRIGDQNRPKDGWKRIVDPKMRFQTSAQWARIGQNGSKFNNSKTIGFREKIVKYEMSIYAKTKSLLICVYSVLVKFSRIFFSITTKLHFTVTTSKEQFHIFKF